MPATAQRPALDLPGLLARVDLGSVLTAYLGQPDGRSNRPRWRCPWHVDDNPSLATWDGGKRWRCWPCALQGDALDFVMRHDGVELPDAARLLDPSLEGPTGRHPTTPRPSAPARPTPKPPAWHSAEWQDAADRLISQAEAALWSPAGRRALDWLRWRGLEEHTIRRHRLGFSPGWQRSGRLEVLRNAEGPQPISMAPGVVMPWPAPIAADDDAPRWVGANVRRLADDPFAPLPPKTPKCHAFAESARGFAYPWPEILPTQAGPSALVVEGELDALVAAQEAGHLAHAVTVGGSASEPNPSALALLALCPWLLIATDYDAPGIQAAGRWIARFPHKARRVLLPHGKDLGDFHQAGGDVRAWLAAELARLDLRPTSTRLEPSRN